eukprot:4665338-Amphidinium_carterae.1
MLQPVPKPMKCCHKPHPLNTFGLVGASLWGKPKAVLVHQKRLPPNKLQAAHTPLKETVRNSLPLNIVFLLCSL